MAWEFSDVSTSKLDYGDIDVITQGDTGVFSAYAVVKLDSITTGDQLVIGQNDNSNYGWRLGFDDAVSGTSDLDRFKFWNRDFLTDNENEVYADAAAVVDTWYTLGGSYTADVGGAGPTNNFYIDGVANTSTREFTLDAGIHLNINNLSVGASGRSNDELDGIIGPVAIWDGVHLTATEHLQLAQGADPRTIQPDFLTFYSRLEELDAVNYVSLATPTVGVGTNFNTDRWPDFKPFIQGLGEVTATTIKIQSHVGRTADHKIQYSPATDLSYDTETAVITSLVGSDFVVVHELTGLSPNTIYNYRVSIDGKVVYGSASTFKTAPSTNEGFFRFVFSSCSEFDFNIPPLYDRYSRNTFNGIDARNPNFAIHSGDVWYSDQGGSDGVTAFNAYTINTVEAFNRKAMQSLSERDFALFQQKYPFYMMPDDHEWKNDVDGTDTGDSAYAKATDRILNWQYQKNPTRHPNAIIAGGLWYTFSYAGVDFFMLDTRTQRGTNGNDAHTMLGNTLGDTDGQLGDLLSWIDASDAKFKVVIGGCPISEHGKSSGNDNWRNAFPTDQTNVINLLKVRDDVIYLGGDVHSSGHVRIAANADGNPSHDFYEFIGGTYGGHLTAPSTENDLEHVLLKAYDGRGVDGLDPGRYSYLMIDVNTAVTPSTMDVKIISHNFDTGAETVEWDTNNEGLTIESTWESSSVALITQSKSSFEFGTILAQTAQFSGSKTIDKASLNLTLTNSNTQTMVIGAGGVLSFSAAAFQNGRNTWAFQPVIHWNPSKNWTTNGTTIENTLQTISYLSSVDASMNAPFVKYKLFLDNPGTYDLWGFGYTSSEGVYWSFDDDTSDMRKMVLGSPSGPPQWTKFGSFFSKEGGQHTFSIYLSDATTVVLDQWYFTKDPNFDQMISSGLEFIPLDLSKGPFNTAMRVRSLSPYGTLDDLVSPTPGSSVVTQWLSSEIITASGTYHYGLQNLLSGTGVDYLDGLSIEFWQIGGSFEFFPSWDFVFPTMSVGTAWISMDFGENFAELS